MAVDVQSEKQNHAKEQNTAEVISGSQPIHNFLTEEHNVPVQNAQAGISLYQKTCPHPATGFRIDTQNITHPLDSVPSYNCYHIFQL